MYTQTHVKNQESCSRNNICEFSNRKTIENDDDYIFYVELEMHASTRKKILNFIISCSTHSLILFFNKRRD